LKRYSKKTKVLVKALVVPSKPVACLLIWKLLLHKTMFECLLNKELDVNLTVHVNVIKLFEFVNQIQNWKAFKVYSVPYTAK
jgi:hypothetical protein